MVFARRVWKVLVAIKDGLALLLLVMFFALIYAALSAQPGAAAVQKGALLISLDGFVVEEPSAPDPLAILLSQQAPMGEHRARDVVRALRTAAKDDRITAVALDLGGFMGGGLVHLQDIGDALDEVRAAGKKVYAYGMFYMDDALLLAAHADEVWLDPSGGAFITGPGSNRLYFAGLIEKTRVKVNVFRVGTFKSAVEPYLLSGPSDASRRSDEALYGALWDEWQADFRKARPKVDIARVTRDASAWLAQSGGDPARAAKAAGLIDRIGTKSDFNLRLQEVAGKNPRDDSFGAFAQTDMATWLAANPQDKTGKAIGVVTVAGEIVDGDAGPGIAGAGRIVKVIEDAYDDDLAALVLRVDSPGGSIVGSEHIRRAVQRFRDRNVPVVVSMANLGASGGYWVSTPGQRIFAQPGTITGSIGVYAVLPTFGEALGQFGISSENIGTTPLSGQPDPLKGISPEVAAMLQGTIENNYGKFVSLVETSRKLPTGRAADWAEGRPWAGGAARQFRLIDEFGGLDDALAHAAKLAKLKDGEWHAEYLGQGPTSPLAAILGSFASARRGGAAAHGDLFAAVAARQEQAIMQFQTMLARMTGSRGVQAMCLECPTPVPAPQDSARAADTGRLLALLKALTA